MSENPKGWKQVPDPIVPKPDSLLPKVGLRTTTFDDIVKQQGVRVKVYRTTYCPNVKSLSGEHQIDCTLCYGSQFVDCYPIETFAFIQNQTLDKKVFVEGLYDGNAVAATFLQGIALHYFTLVELQDFTEVFIDRIKRQNGQMDMMRYPVTRVNFLIDQDGKHYEQGDAFNLDWNGNIVWCDNKGPESGKIYSLNYDMKIRFRALKAMHVTRFAQIVPPAGGDKTVEMVAMNQQWLLQKDYNIVRKDAFTRQPLPENKNYDFSDQPLDLELGT